MTAVMAALKAGGVADKDITTTFFNITPVYTYNKDTGRQTIDALQRFQYGNRQGPAPWATPA